MPRMVSASRLGAERMLDVVALSGCFSSGRLAGDRALDSFLRSAAVVVLDLGVVGCFPVDEHANADEHVISFVSGNDAFGNSVLNGPSNTGLSRAKHLNGLTGVLDGDLVEHHGARLARQVWSDHCKQRRETVLVVGEAVAESSFSGGATRTDDQVDVRDFITVTDERLANQNLVDFGHSRNSPKAEN